MKKVLVCLAAVMTVCSLAACKPTEITETLPTVAETANPEGITPEMIQESTSVPEKLPDPDAPILERAVVYYINDAGTGLANEAVDLEEMTEETLVEELIAKGVLAEGTEVNTFGITGGLKVGPGVDASLADDSERIGSLDLTQAPQADAAKEQLILNAVANTFIENYELDKLEILIDSEPYSTANITMGEGDYLTFTTD